MGARRLLAALVAIALIALAVIIRNGIDNDGRSSGSGGNPRLVCAPELKNVCDTFASGADVTIEDPGKTADKLENAGADLGIDGWLVPGPWPDMVVEARQRAGKDPLLAVGKPRARSNIGLAVWPDRLALMRQFCKGDLTWKCVGDLAGKGEWQNVGGRPEWGAIKIGIPDPVNDATGLAALGAATAGYFSPRDPATLSSTDLDDSGFRNWLRGLANAQPDNPDLTDMLIRGPAGAAAAATFEAVGTKLVGAAANKPTLTYPAPVASADVVLGIANTDAGRQLTDLVTPESLIKAGWKTSNAPQPTGLPSPGFLDALQSAWQAAAR